MQACSQKKWSDQFKSQEPGGNKLLDRLPQHLSIWDIIKLSTGDAITILRYLPCTGVSLLFWCMVSGPLGQAWPPNKDLSARGQDPPCPVPAWIHCLWPQTPGHYRPSRATNPRGESLGCSSHWAGYCRSLRGYTKTCSQYSCQTFTRYLIAHFLQKNFIFQRYKLYQ